jgi:hypothetical protein
MELLAGGADEEGESGVEQSVARPRELALHGSRDAVSGTEGFDAHLASHLDGAATPHHRVGKEVRAKVLKDSLVHITPFSFPDTDALLALSIQWAIEASSFGGHIVCEPRSLRDSEASRRHHICN